VRLSSREQSFSSLKSNGLLVRRRAANELEEIQVFYLNKKEFSCYRRGAGSGIFVVNMRITTDDDVFVPFLFRLVV
jgi:hypothetical protein